MSFSQIQRLSFLINEVLSDFDSAVLINSDSQILGLKYEALPDLGTFSPLVQMARQYFSPKDGDVILTNDPYSGGNSLSVMNFVTAIELSDQTLYFAARSRFKPSMRAAKKLDEEGLRIPPTPMVSGHQVNEAILAAISAHPMAPEHFEFRVRDTLKKIKSRCELIKLWSQKQTGCFSKNAQKNYLAETKNQIQNILSEMATGESRVELNFDTGEVVRLKTEITNGEIHFDFSGSTQSKRMFTTNHTTHGTCVGAVLSFLGKNFVVNEGLFSVISVVTPQDCMLNAKYPAPVFEGLAEVCSLVASGIVQSLSEITGGKSMGLNGTIPTILSFEFADKKVFFDPLAGGSGATKDKNGLDGFYHWTTLNRQASIEQIEKNFPIRIHECAIRTGSGGKGQYTGGHGVSREIEVLEDCSMKWLLGHKNVQAKNLKGALPGQPSEIVRLAADGTSTKLEVSSGSIELKKGDRIQAKSAGGGGFGKANSPS